MIHFALAMLALCLHSAHLDTAQVGWAAYYRQGLIEQVARVRNMAPERHMAALSGPGGCEKIGSHVWASVAGRPPERFLVIDCSQDRDLATHVREQLLIEVSYEDAQAWGFARAGKAPAIVWRADKE